MVKVRANWGRAVSKSEDYPPGLTHRGKEIFIVFDVIDNRGTTVREALKEISKKLHTKPPHRTTITPVFRVGLELFREDSLMLTDERIDAIITETRYGIPPSRVVELYRLYLLWKAYRHKEIVNIDLVLSTLEERQLKVWFLRFLKHWDEKKIAEKLGVPLRDVQHDNKEIEIKGQLERHKTKEETKMEQESMLNLPPWVNQAQWEHLEGKERLDERGGLDIITYPSGPGIRQQLELFENCFADINPRYHSFWHPLDEAVVTQLWGHLPDKAFWSKVEDYSEKAGQCEALLDAAYERFTSSGEELALLQPSRGPTPDKYITSGWARRVLVRALNPELGFREPDKYYPRELKEGDFILEDEEIIYRGPDTVAAEQRHRELVKGFINSDKFPPIVNLMKDLRNLRQQILARIGQCLRRREYSFNYCPDCPADQARKMLASKEE